MHNVLGLDAGTRTVDVSYSTGNDVVGSDRHSCIVAFDDVSCVKGFCLLYSNVCAQAVSSVGRASYLRWLKRRSLSVCTA